MSVKVIDLNEEVKPELPTIEETKEDNKEEEFDDDDDDDDDEIKNEVVEEQNTKEVPEQPKEQTQEAPKPKRQTQKDRIQCSKCFKEMSVKSYKYSHDKNCRGQLSERPVKKQAKPKAKQTPRPKPKPVPEVYYSESEEEEDAIYKPVVKKKSKPAPQASNPLLDITNQYALLQQQMMQKKQERYSKVCQNMFMSIPKKR